MFLSLLACFCAPHDFQVVAYHGAADCYTIDGKIVNEHITIAKPLGNCAIITDSQFVGIHSIFDNGGAILFSSDAINSSIYCARTVFTDCSTDLRGGAIYAKVMSFQLAVNCIFNCSAKIEGQFAFVSQTAGSCEVNETSLVSCSSTTGQTALHVDTAAVLVANMNCSANQVPLGSAGLRISSQYVHVRSCEFVGCTGASVLRLSSKANLFNVTHCNVVGNKCSSGPVAFGGGLWTISEFIFADNGDRCFARENSAGSLIVVSSVFDVKQMDVAGVSYSGCIFEASTETYDICHMNTQLCPAVHTCSPGPEPEPEGNKNPWSRKEVVGALIGGMTGCMVVGTLIGIGVMSMRRKAIDEQASSAKLLTE